MLFDGDLAGDIERIAGEVSILSGNEYTIRGETRKFHELPERQVDYPAGTALSSQLESELYALYYCRPSQLREVPVDTVTERSHLHELSKVNCGRGPWERGWKLVGSGKGGTLAVKKDRVSFLADPESVRIDEKLPDDMMSCSVRLTKERFWLSPGFYFAIGDCDLSGADKIVRFYWSMKASAAVNYVREVTHALNREAIPFRAKVLSSPDHYFRADSGVLYVQHRFTATIKPVINTLYCALQKDLRRSVPMFSKTLAPGLGLAEDPGSGLSFGNARCAVLARGLWLAGMEHAEPGEAVTFVERAFVDAGLSPSKPYLCEGHSEQYEHLRLF